MTEKNNNNSSLKKSFTIKIPYILVEKQLNVEYDKLSKSLKIQGFRPGKVPLSFIRNKLLLFFVGCLGRASIQNQKENSDFI